ncbi:MAG: hypothetical protein ACR2RL_18490 [Gammaproteobacteria bacterium]
MIEHKLDLESPAGQMEKFISRPERWCYDKPAAERHWERLIALYRRRP